MSNSESFLIDTDTASDDAVALLMALRDPRVVVRGITLVGGNVTIAEAARNAAYAAELCGPAVPPFFLGAGKPLRRPPIRAYYFHGRDGLGDMNYPRPRTRPQRES